MCSLCSSPTQLFGGTLLQPAPVAAAGSITSRPGTPTASHTHTHSAPRQSSIASDSFRSGGKALAVASDNCAISRCRLKLSRCRVYFRTFFAHSQQMMPNEMQAFSCRSRTIPDASQVPPIMAKWGHASF